MGTHILICWLGMTDLKAASGATDVGVGPVAQAAVGQAYKEVVLLNNLEKDTAIRYVAWLQKKTPSKITLHNISLSDPTNFSEIYKAASTISSQKVKEYGPDVGLVFHLSPGTPAMAAVWILLAKTVLPAELIESSTAHGVRTVQVPFDISVDFIPDLFRKPDQTLERLAAGLPSAAPEFDDIIHRSEVMRRVVLKARRIAPRSIPVLIEGESGTGKELLARAIHDASPRKDKSFVAINCGAIPSELVESEFFGHEKGAFTGAFAGRTGYFEAAHQGTIFLDEIGELPKDIQVKLLRTLQEGEVKRVGATRSRKVDIRIIAATNRNLVDMVAAGSFREDLFYRIAVAVIKLPPLRERAGDLSLLIDRFLEQITRESLNELSKNNKEISVSARNLYKGRTKSETLERRLKTVTP
jgi:sigma54-dependent transcription regulator